VLVEDGEMEFALTATQEAFDGFAAALEKRGLRYDLLSLIHADEEGSLLTERQRECLLAALREGYFEVPRACTLGELARDAQRRQVDGKRDDSAGTGPDTRGVSRRPGLILTAVRHYRIDRPNAGGRIGKQLQ
jgi:hypothetical protein